MKENPPAPPFGMAEISVYADLVQVYSPEDSNLADRAGGFATRGLVTKFSRSSRRRMQQKLAKVRGLTWGYFATLTYPDKFPQEPDVWHRDLKVVIQRLQRLSWSSMGMWRLELKTRLSGEYEGWLAPHFHLLIFPTCPQNKPKLAVLRRWLRMAWYDVAHDGDAHQGGAGTQIDPITSRRHAVNYVNKYAAKVEQSFSIIAPIGRHWGVWGNMDLSASVRVLITHAQLVELKRVMRNWISATGTKPSRAYARKLSRAPPAVGISLFGLGDTSHALFNDDCVATIFRMIEICHRI